MQLVSLACYKVAAMTKSQLKRKLKARGEEWNDRAIAEIFGIYPQAVQAWPKDRPMPQLRILQLKDKRPELFS